MQYGHLDSNLITGTHELACLHVTGRPRRFRTFIALVMDRLGLAEEQAYLYARIAYNHIRDELELNGGDVADMDDSCQVIAQIRRMRSAGDAREQVIAGYLYEVLSVQAHDAETALFDDQIAHDSTRAVSNARQLLLCRFDDAELSVAELHAEMDVLDNKIAELAMNVIRAVRHDAVTRCDDGELTLPERDAKIGFLDKVLALVLHAHKTPPEGLGEAKQDCRSLSPAALSVSDHAIEARYDSLLNFQSAVNEFADAEIGRLVQAIIEDMRNRPAQGMFGEIAARHMWDEYCWSLQEGPFDDDIGWDGVCLGSLSGAFEGMIRAVIEAEIEKLPRHAQVFLSAKAIEDDLDMGEDALGSIWMDGMFTLVIEGVNSAASARHLDLIGPDRSDVISYEIEGSGTVWSVLSDLGEAMELVQSHVDELIDPDGDLSTLAAELADAYIAAAKGAADGTTVSELFDNFEDQIRDLLTERDVLPALEDMRARLVERLDG